MKELTKVNNLLIWATALKLPHPHKLMITLKLLNFIFFIGIFPLIHVDNQASITKYSLKKINLQRKFIQIIISNISHSWSECKCKILNWKLCKYFFNYAHFCLLFSVENYWSTFWQLFDATNWQLKTLTLLPWVYKTNNYLTCLNSVT